MSRVRLRPVSFGAVGPVTFNLGTISLGAISLGTIDLGTVSLGAVVRRTSAKLAVERMRIGPALSRPHLQSGALTRFGLGRLAIGVGSLCAALLTAAPLRAEPEILDGDAFRALAEGHTLWFEQGGRPFGVEQYLEGDRTLWRPEGGPCEEGIWFESNGTICFLYDNGLGPQCWIVTRRGGEIFARSVGDPDGLAELRMSDRSTETLGCPGPSLGV